MSLINNIVILYCGRNDGYKVSVWETFFTKVAFDSIVEVRFRTYNLSIKRGGEYEWN